MKTTQRKAKVGGEFGANGEWYEGGKFINTVAENAKKEAARRKAASRKQQIEPGVFACDEEGRIAIFPQLAGVEIFDKATGTFSFNPALRSNFATPEAITNRTDKINRYNAGERWT